jgi:hypothetical protein
MGGHPFKPYWWLTAIILTLSLLGIMVETAQAEDAEDKLATGWA